MLARRLVLVFSIVFCAFLALAVGVSGAGGGFGPGQFSFKSQSASAFFGGGKGAITPQPTFSVSVNRGLNSFEAEDGSGNTTIINNTIVFFTMFNPDGTGGFGCFVIPSSDFVVSGDLQTASLHTTLLSTSQCPGFGKPVGQANTSIMAGGGKGGGSLPPSIRVDLTWTGANVVSNMTDQFSLTCLSRQIEGQNTFRDSLGGSASGTIAGTSGLNTLSADVASQDGQLQIQGTSTPPCFI